MDRGDAGASARGPGCPAANVLGCEVTSRAKLRSSWYLYRGDGKTPDSNRNWVTLSMWEKPTGPTSSLVREQEIFDLCNSKLYNSQDLGHSNRWALYTLKQQKGGWVFCRGSVLARCQPGGMSWNQSDLLWEKTAAVTTHANLSQTALRLLPSSSLNVPLQKSYKVFPLPQTLGTSQHRKPLSCP